MQIPHVKNGRPNSNTAGRLDGQIARSGRAGAVPFHRNGGFTFTELVIVIVILSLFVLLAQMHLLGALRKSTFKAQVQSLISAMRMAAAAAAESDKRYEVIIDIAQQGFLLRRITSPDLSQVLEEEIILDDSFAESCRVIYVEFDDGDYTNEGRAKFRAGRSGWQYGGKIVLVDEMDKPYSVVINRLSRIITLEEGEAQLLKPKPKEEVPF